MAWCLKVVDTRRPPPPGSVIDLEAHIVLGIRMEARGSVISRSYPQAPTDFTATPDVHSLWQRYEDYMEGKEPIASMAYFCLTLVESVFGGQGKNPRSAAARVLAIDAAILGKLGELTSTRGDHRSARKFRADPVASDFTAGEKAWIELAVRRLILQVGRISPGVAPSRLTMNDLPAL